MRKVKKTRRRGMALLLATLFTALALVALGAYTVQLTGQAHQADYLCRHTRCFTAAESAVAQSRALLEAGQPGSVGFSGRLRVTGDGRLALPAFGDEDVSPQAFASDPEVTYFSVASPWGSDELDNNRDGRVDEAEERAFCTLWGFARLGALHRGVEVVIERVNTESPEDTPAQWRQVSWRELPPAGPGNPDVLSQSQ